MFFNFSPLIHSFRLGWRDAWSNKIALGSLVFSYLVSKGLWTSVWLMVPESTLSRLSIQYGSIIWYAVVTGIVNYPAVRAYRVIESDIHSGGLAFSLIRPVSYLALKITEWAGVALVRTLTLAPVAFALSYSVTGYWPFAPVQLVGYIVSVFLGVFLWLMIHALIGLSTAWVHSPRTVYQLVGKGVLVLGGVILPISHYPGWVQAIAWCTPFPAMLYIPAHQVITPIGAAWFGFAAIQLAWIGAAGLAAVVLFRRLEKRLLTQGGI